MPRIGRLHIPGGCCHVMGSGLERSRIFNTDVDKDDFLDRLGEALTRNGVKFWVPGTPISQPVSIVRAKPC